MKSNKARDTAGERENSILDARSLSTFSGHVSLNEFSSDMILLAHVAATATQCGRKGGKRGET